MQGKLPVAVLDGMAGVGAALEADDDVGLIGKHVRDLAFALVSPVCSYYCCDHRNSS